MTDELRKRWNSDAGRSFVEKLIRAGRSGNGYEIRESPFGTLNATGQLDLRGLALPERTELRRVTCSSADFAAAVFKRAWIENSAFTDSSFDNCLLQMMGEKINIFDNCTFRSANLRRAVLGYNGSRFRQCQFVRADFIQAGFIRAEFDDCYFDSCTFSGVDFWASSFVKCEFRGDLRGVWFHGEYAVPSYIEQLANARRNKMERVSFEHARLLDVTFSDQCDLSTVIPPTDGRHALLDRWPQRINSVYHRSRDWPEPCQKEGELFFKAFEAHAKKQDWYLLGIDDLVNRHGKLPGIKIWEVLISAPFNLAHGSHIT
jgi:fluoroquinolone resistance protein